MICPVCGLRLSTHCDKHGWPPSLVLSQHWRAGEGYRTPGVAAVAPAQAERAMAS